MKKIIYISAILILVFSDFTMAQQQGFWKTFTTADGLIANKVLAIEESGDGALWFGTSGGGASCYQNSVWTTFDTTNGLTNNFVQAILESSDGALWFGTQAGVSRYLDGIWTTFTTVDGLADSNVSAIAESRAGALWFGTLGGGVSRYQDGTWTTFTTADGLADNNVSDIEESNDRTLWFGTQAGVSCYKNGIWTTFTTADGLGDNEVSAIEASNNGVIWFGTGRGASRYQNGVWTPFTKRDGLAADSVLAILELSDETLWFGTNGGVSRYQNGSWTIFTMYYGLANNIVWAIHESSDEALWFGTNGGLSRYRDNIWTTLTETDGLADNDVLTILDSNDGALWFGTYGGGISRYQDGNWTHFNTNNVLKNNVVQASLASNDGALWFGTYGGGVSRYQDQDSTWTTFTTMDGLANDSIFAIEESSNGTLWFGTYGGGVSRYQNGIWTTLNTDSGLANNYVLAIKASSDSALWFGTQNGVSRYQNGIWKTFTSAEGLVNDTVRAIEECIDGALWFGTSVGSCRYRSGGWTNFTPINGLADNYVNAIRASSDGALWLGTYGGVSRYQDNIWTTLTETDGLANNYVQAIEESSNRAIWFGTCGGVSRLKPDRSPPVTFITQAPKKITGTPTPLFVFGGRDFRTSQDRLCYSHTVVEASRLPDSSDWQPFMNLTAIQTQFLENGTYRFYVRARDTWRNVDPIPAKWTFTVDITQPTVVINSPKQEQHIKGEFPIIGSAFDNSPIKDFKHYQLSRDSLIFENQVTEWKAFTDSISSTAKDDTLGILNTNVLNDGTHWIRLWAKDTLKHTNEDIVRVTIDNTIPQVKITFPHPDDTVRNEVNIGATITDDNLDKYLLKYKIVIQNQWYEIPQDSLPPLIGNQFKYLWKNTSDSGFVIIKLTAQDTAGNVTRDSVQFLLDNKDYSTPTAIISEPPNNDYKNGLVDVIGTATDDDFTKYQLFLRSQTIDTLLVESDIKKENEILATFNSKTFPDGEYKFVLTAFNNKQYHETVIRSIIIDNTSPTAKILYPSSGDTVSCTVQIQGEASDENLKKITLNYAPFLETNLDKYTLIDTTFAKWNTIDLNGNYKLILTVEDQGGLTTTIENGYYIDNPVYENDEGLLKQQDEVSLYIPPNGYKSSVICIDKITMEECAFNPSIFTPTELIFDIQSSVEDSIFTKPAVLTIDYSDSKLSQNDENNLRIFNCKNAEWTLIGGDPIKDEKIVKTAINEIGIYGLFKSKITPGSEEKDLKVACEPRVFSPNGCGFDIKTSIIFELGKPTDVTIKIYNTAGRLIRLLRASKSMPDGRNVIDWYGKDQGGDICVTGLYIVAVQAKDKIATKTVVVMNK